MSGWAQVWVSKLNERHWIVKQLLPRRINWVSKTQSDYWSALKSLDSAIITDVGLKISWERRWKGTSCLRGPVQGGLRGLRGGHTRGHFEATFEEFVKTGNGKSNSCTFSWLIYLPPDIVACLHCVICWAIFWAGLTFSLKFDRAEMMDYWGCGKTWAGQIFIPFRDFYQNSI